MGSSGAGSSCLRETIVPAFRKNGPSSVSSTRAVSVPSAAMPA